MVAAVVLALGLACLLLAAKLQGGESLVQRVLIAQMTGRMNDRDPGYAYYWLRCFTSYAPAYPLAIIVVISRYKDILGRKNDDDILLGSLACWILIVLVGMSIPSIKKARYILPIVPALSLAASYVLIDTTPKFYSRRRRYVCPFVLFCLWQGSLQL
jgi:4-amino-4-deoxy-L-arabinose transferase-like glycosyltransferase